MLSTGRFLLGLVFVVSVELLILGYLDVTRIYDAGQVGELRAGGPAPAATAAADGATPSSSSATPASSAAAPVLLPAVALLFLTRGDLPTEPLWRLFLDSASAAVQQTSGAAPSAATSVPAWQQLFTLYVHPAPGFQLKADSLFSGHEVPDRVEVHWGQHSVVDAERVLLRAALLDPRNQRFVLLSDSCIPLYPAPLVYAQLVTERRSRINACRDPTDPDDYNKRMEFRWKEPMAGYGVPREMWRKSQQWFMLTRLHAEAVVADTQVDAALRAECWTAADNSRFCASDEHYIPTLLAVGGMEGETSCAAGVITYARWEGNYFHPKTFRQGDAPADVLAEMRGGCNGSALAAVSIQEVGRLLQQPGLGTGAAAPQPLLEQAAAPHLLAPSCPLFGRKVARLAARYWVQYMQAHVMNALWVAGL